ncbi:nucleotidyl transferase AbiEii/AbiGii toxin family protein [Candidatus Microthrix parvicella]|uniref:nucleotidyl transferase AbiEii/AbiGii toxin family protein n=1 Tax=Candidatus Neomicrothrix parvicella TaxID=41950 RepID=UPI000368782C|nr:nucleotidyl transferase AbiEii/AbiGii toxin family protein [Candidatus Microthrix parvicella]
MAAGTLTEALVRLHGAGRADTYGAALLDVAQDHLLWLLAELGHFDDGTLVFKGGTALRKCRLGSGGRFSTDLDFVAPDDDTVLEVCESIDGASVAGFQYSLQSTRGDGRHWTMQVRHPQLGQPDVATSVEFARRPLILRPERIGFVHLSIHRVYEIALPELPVIAEAEACAEKLARYRRVALGRDVYDLAQFASGAMDEALVRRLWVLKVWGDVVDDGRGDKPADPADILEPRSEGDFAPDSIGKLTQPVDLRRWERVVRERFEFLVALDEDERRWAACDPCHRHEIEAAISAS